MDHLQTPWRSHASFSIVATTASDEKPGCLSTIDTFGLKEVDAKDAKCWMQRMQGAVANHILAKLDMICSDGSCQMIFHMKC